MYREAGARRGEYFNPKCSPHSRAFTRPVVVQKARRAQEKGYKYTQV